MHLLSALQEPFLFTRTAGNAFAHELSRRIKRLDRLERLIGRRGIGLLPRRVHAPNLSKLDALESQLRSFPTRRRLLTVKQFSAYMDALRQMRGSVAALGIQLRKCRHNARQERYLARIGRLFLDAPPAVLEGFILNRNNRRGSNFHAAALARMRGEGLTREKLAEWGRKGAEARWRNSRAATVADGTITSRGES
jgi:hypothetical protein